MEIVCYRDVELERVPRQMPAHCYNLAHSLLARSSDGVLFVPIRSMQYLAILDAEEFVFLDSENRRWIELAWQNFKPQQRTALDEPVGYEAVYYGAKAAEVVRRLQNEFTLALRQLAARDQPQGPASVIKLAERRPH